MFHFPSTKTTPIEIEGLSRPMREPEPLPEPVLVRRSVGADAARIAVLARLDDKRLPAGPFLVAEVAGSVVAAMSLSSGVVVADPFRHTADAVAMLRLRSHQVSAGGAVASDRRRGRGASERALATAAA